MNILFDGKLCENYVEDKDKWGGDDAAAKILIREGGGGSVVASKVKL